MKLDKTAPRVAWAEELTPESQAKASGKLVYENKKLNTELRRVSSFSPGCCPFSLYCYILLCIRREYLCSDRQKDIDIEVQVPSSNSG